jgi:hypothetical protein
MTTITTDMLRYIAHTLGASVDYTRQVLSSEFDTEFDDTPVDDTEKDTEEQTTAMTTITQEQFYDLWHHGGKSKSEFREYLERKGYTITPAEPPEMVKLAVYVVQQAIGRQQIAPSERSVQDMEAGALAMAQHVVDETVLAANQCPDRVWGPWMAQRILTALGAGGRDAG